MIQKKKQYALRSGDLKPETVETLRCCDEFIRNELVPQGLLFNTEEEALYASATVRAFLLALASTRGYAPTNKQSRTHGLAARLRQLFQGSRGQTHGSLEQRQKHIEETARGRIHAWRRGVR